jgi:hypothetical protein
MYKSTIFKTDAMSKKLRKLPPVCLSVALLDFLTGNLRMSREFVGCKTISDDGQAFTIFRQIKKRKPEIFDDCTTFVVKFKFARLSHRANKLASIIPMLLIAGFPGFVQKLYAVNNETGYWQGMYEWKSVNHLESYKKSFVYRMMNKRALKGTVQSRMIPNCHLSDLILPIKP